MTRETESRKSLSSARGTASSHTQGVASSRRVFVTAYLRRERHVLVGHGASLSRDHRSFRLDTSRWLGTEFYQERWLGIRHSHVLDFLLGACLACCGVELRSSLCRISQTRWHRQLMRFSRIASPCSYAAYNEASASSNPQSSGPFQSDSDRLDRRRSDDRFETA